MELKIEIQNKGNLPGTLGWLKSIIENQKLIIAENKYGSPTMFLEDNDGKRTFICRVKQPDDDAIFMYEPDNGFLKCFPVEDEHRYGLVGYSLTDAALKAAEEFINNALAKYQQWWNSDKENL